MKSATATLACLLCWGCAPPPDRVVLPPPPRAPPFVSDTARWVDPFIGTANEGNTFPGAVAPWGMASPSPHNAYSTPLSYGTAAGLAPSGYVHGRPYIMGLGLTHLSGVGCPDLGTPVVAAVTGPLRLDDTPASYRSRYRDQVAWPGYYAVTLTDHAVVLEATATPRGAALRLRLPADGGDAHLLLDVGSKVSWLRGSGQVRVVSPSEVEGAGHSGFFCAKGNRQTVYFVARVSAPADGSGTWKDGQRSSAPQQTGDAGAFLRFGPTAPRVITLRVGLSYVSLQGARRNLEAELAGRDFEQLRAATFGAWEQALGRVRVQGGSAAQRTIFYSALYHALLHPNLISDVDGRHPRMGGGAPAHTAGTPRYSVYSLWDSYRTVHPLLTLIYPERQLQLLRSLAQMAAESGRPPAWELAGHEVNMMVGDPAAVMVADSHAKGLRGFDEQRLYATMRAAALDTGSDAHRPGNAEYRALGYVPMEQASKVWGPVSTTLEYNLSDWALSRLAAALGRPADAALFAAQARSYRKLFHGASGLLRPKNRDGSWYTPFNPDAITGSRSYQRSGGPGFVEGTAWHYAFFVPHDVAGLVSLHGGEAALTRRLQQVFDSGRFVLWNEPDMAYPYLFTRLHGQAWRARLEARRAMARFFSATPAGLPGNDDAGTLSAWYVWSAMGLYPDLPGSTRYSLGSPIFSRVEIALSGAHHRGQRFVIEAPAAAPGRPHVRSMKLNGAAHATPWLDHAQITAGGRLWLELAASR